MDMWKKYNIGVYLFDVSIYTDIFLSSEAAEEVDSGKTLELDDEQYPQLPESILKLWLHHQKAVLRQFMGAVRSI